jgi:hypothetical protein
MVLKSWCARGWVGMGWACQVLDSMHLIHSLDGERGGAALATV